MCMYQVVAKLPELSPAAAAPYADAALLTDADVPGEVQVQ